MSAKAEAERRFDEETGNKEEVDKIGEEFLRVSNKNPITRPISSKAKQGNVKERLGILTAFKKITR